MPDTLVVNEVFLSLQGESTFAGLPCIFIRLTGCNLRCSYCDTAYAFTDGARMKLGAVLAEVRRLAAPFGHLTMAADGTGLPHPLRHPASGIRHPVTSPPAGCHRLPLVELTGGEPLLQPNSLPLMKSLGDDGFTVLLETSGARDVSPVDPRVHRILDLKCPSSGESEQNRWENLHHLKPTDEIKFVIATCEDYVWAKEQIAERQLAALCPLLVSWATPLTAAQQDKSLKKVPPAQTSITRQQLAERVIADALPVRFQLQMHKFIWPPEQRGV